VLWLGQLVRPLHDLDERLVGVVQPVVAHDATGSSDG
jgi:hypothetical protein